MTKHTGWKAFLVYGAILLSGCMHQQKRPLPDVSHIQVPPIKIERFDQALTSLDTHHLHEALAALYKQYPVFMPVYFEQIMNYGPYSDTNQLLFTEVKAMLQSKDIHALQDTINKHFADLSWLENQLRQGFQYLKYYYPHYAIPRVVSFYSGLNNFGAVTVDSVLGIGLDMFLGENYPFYQQVADPYPTYMLHQFSPEYIVPNCFKVIEQQLYPPKQEGSLLDMMVQAGKQLYFLDAILPHAPDSVKIGFTQQQLNWCKQNERMIWQYFIQNDLLYVRDMQQVMHYIGPGPSTQGMPKESPGNIGSWVGWQIVRKYMREHPQVSLLQLMQLNDAQKLLTDSRYRP
ncbi:MAG: hypothetical protein K6T34_03695 [Thermoflavifilum sp.]|nr:hypothetical protein [Thermoflavifilum sp.]